MTQPAYAEPGTLAEVFRAFFRLGLVSFGGPVAHLGYFRSEFVHRRGWLTDSAYAQLVALCQFLPGPASSQVGFALGYLRSGWLGALAAFVAFTVPSALIMVGFAAGAHALGGPWLGVITGLKIVAVAIVAHAVMGMARTLTPDPARASIAVGALCVALIIPGWFGHIGAIVLGAGLGVLIVRASPGRYAPSTKSDHNTGDTPGGTATLKLRITPATGITCLVLFTLLLFGLPALARFTSVGWIELFAGFFRAGALVFGGGHVVLPLLEAQVVGSGWVTQADFLAGYGVAQAMPGPLFTFAPYLGFLADLSATAWANAAPPAGGAATFWLGVAQAAVATVAIFTPGFLLLCGVLPGWHKFTSTQWAIGIVTGANAAVVGILGAALYSPVFVSAVVSGWSLCLAVVCFVLLVAWKCPPWAVVIVGACGGLLGHIFA